MLGYRFATEELALRIGHERCPPVEVELEPWCFVVRAVGREARFGIGEMDVLTDHVLAELERERRAGVKKLPLWLVGGHLLELRERALPRVNAPAAEVLRRVLAVARRAPRLVGVPALYAEPYVVQDVLRYRAAAIALAFLDSELLAPWLAARGHEAHGASHDATALAALRDWRSLFSPDGRTYRSLDRTLMNLPQTMPAGLVCLLRFIRLDRPVTSRFVLATLLLLLQDRRFTRHPEQHALATLVLRAGEQDVAEACAALGAHTERDLSPRRLRDLRFLVSFVVDYPARFHGDLPGLVRRAVRWHEQRARLQARAAEARQRETEAARQRAEAALRRAALGAWQDALAEPAEPRRTGRPHAGAVTPPPIALPSLPGVTFLATTAAIQEEGARMEHCIAEYVDDAVAGDCFLFHVSHGGSEASVEVDRRGWVRQACGPRNVKNAATRWGARVLREWGRKLGAARVRSAKLADAR